jgi:hypothetical protein
LCAELSFYRACGAGLVLGLATHHLRFLQLASLSFFHFLFFLSHEMLWLYQVDHAGAGEPADVEEPGVARESDRHEPERVRQHGAAGFNGSATG